MKLAKNNNNNNNKRGIYQAKMKRNIKQISR